MAAFETVALSIFSLYPSSSPSSCTLLSPLKPLHSIRPNFSISHSTPSFSPLPLSRNLCSQLCSALQELSVEKEEAHDTNPKGRLFVYNLPCSDSVEDVQNLFVDCGKVEDVERVKTRYGKRKSHVFVTMASEEEAQSVIDQFDSQEVLGMIMRVEFAKTLEKPALPPPLPRTLQSRVHVANVDFKVRAAHLREFFSTSFNPISARVVFQKNRTTGYGFVGFATKEEAEAAIAVLDRKDLMGRQLRLALSDKNTDESASKNEEENLSEDLSNES